MVTVIEHRTGRATRRTVLRPEAPRRRHDGLDRSFQREAAWSARVLEAGLDVVVAGECPPPAPARPPRRSSWTAKLDAADELMNAVEDDSTGDTSSPWECLY